MSAASASSTDLTRQKTRFENTTTPPVTAQSCHSKGAAKTARRPTAPPSALVLPVEDDGSWAAQAHFRSVGLVQLYSSFDPFKGLTQHTAKHTHAHTILTAAAGLIGKGWRRQ